MCVCVCVCACACACSTSSPQTCYLPTFVLSVLLAFCCKVKLQALYDFVNLFPLELSPVAHYDRGSCCGVIDKHYRKFITFQICQCYRGSCCVSSSRKIEASSQISCLPMFLTVALVVAHALRVQILFRNYRKLTVFQNLSSFSQTYYLSKFVEFLSQH